jgi:hypothetical protein
MKYSNTIWILLYGTLISPIISQAQSHAIPILPADTISLKPPEDNVTSQEDIMDILEKVVKINRVKQADSEAIKPGKLLLAIFPAVGYTFVNQGVAIISANISFYTGNPHNTDLSTVTANPQYSTRHQIIVPIISDIWLEENKINLLGDYRFYKYPSVTYGLGSLSSLGNSDQIDYSYIKIYQEMLKCLSNNLYGGFGYNYDYHFNISDAGDATDFEKYNNNASSTTSSGLVMHLKYDSRTNINNPQNAFFGSVIYRSNFTWLGSSENWQDVQLEFRKYISFSSTHESVLAFWSWNVFTFGGKAPYLDLPSLGWDTYANTGRGYIQGRFRGTDLVYLEGEYRFGVTNNGLIGGVIFANAVTVPEWPSGLFKAVNPGEGIGIRIKMNRFSDTNLCIDYALGTQGSGGFFFNLGEVF